MLSDLRVRDLGVIEDLTLELGPGMTALTGETGAGKTLLVQALQLVLGQRADAGIVRAGSAEALVEARFFEDTTEELIVSRSVPSNGRSRCTVDGRMVPLATLAEMAPGLIDIHGQHDQQSLLTHSAQRRALDVFAGVDVAPLESARLKVHGLNGRIDALGGDAQQRAREADVLGHQIREIDEASLEDPDEEERLADEEATLGNIASFRAAAAAALSVLDGENIAGADSTALEALSGAVSSLSGHSQFAEWEVRLRAVVAEVGDIASDLRAVVETWEDDPERMSQIQERRRLIADLKKKYGPTRADVLAFFEQGRQRLAQLDQDEREGARLEQEKLSCEHEVQRLESEVLKVRLEAAPKLASAAEARLRELAMPGARLEVSVKAERAGEDVRFLLGANRGEAVRRLAQVASGGELARAMLALRLVASGGPPTVIFDEVDAGVGGEAALALAKSLAELARERQVLIVTHLPQVAALADHQIALRKVEKGGRTMTDAQNLNGQERVVEISRMLSGHPDSAKARAHAEELLAVRASTLDAEARD